MSTRGDRLRDNAKEATEVTVRTVVIAPKRSNGDVERIWNLSSGPIRLKADEQTPEHQQGREELVRHLVEMVIARELEHDDGSLVGVGFRIEVNPA